MYIVAGYCTMYTLWFCKGLQFFVRLPFKGKGTEGGLCSDVVLLAEKGSLVYCFCVACFVGTIKLFLTTAMPDGGASCCFGNFSIV